MLKKQRRIPKPYKILIMYLMFILLCIEIYVFTSCLRTVNVTSFDVEVATANIEINETRKTFNIIFSNDNFKRISREYKEVLAYSFYKLAVIDIDNKLKIIDVNENILVVFDDFSLDLEHIKSTKLFEEDNITKVSIVENKDGKDSNIEYYYDNNTKETYVINNNH